MHISFDTENLSDLDRQILTLLTGGAPAPAPAEAPKPKSRKATTVKVTPAPAEEPKAEEPKAEEPKAEEPKAEEPSENPQAEAVRLATELVQDGRGAEVRDALKAVGAKKVSDLKGDATEQFLTTVRGL